MFCQWHRFPLNSSVLSPSAEAIILWRRSISVAAISVQIFQVENVHHYKHFLSRIFIIDHLESLFYYNLPTLFISRSCILLWSFSEEKSINVSIRHRCKSSSPTFPWMKFTSTTWNPNGSPIESRFVPTRKTSATFWWPQSKNGCQLVTNCW